MHHSIIWWDLVSVKNNEEPEIEHGPLMDPVTQPLSREGSPTLQEEPIVAEIPHASQTPPPLLLEGEEIDGNYTTYIVILYILLICLWRQWHYVYGNKFYSIYIIVQSTDTCFAVPQLISGAWYNLDMAWQPFIPKRLSVTNACGAIAVMCTSRECKAIWGQSAQTTTRVVGVCIIAKGHPLHRVLNNTEVKERNNYIYIYI